MLDKAIRHGKEHREEYRGAKSISRSCRNHGSCPYCMKNRTFNKKENIKMDDEYYQDEAMELFVNNDNWTDWVEGDIEDWGN